MMVADDAIDCINKGNAMKRFSRCMFYIAIGLSVLLCLAAAGLWADSFTHGRIAGYKSLEIESTRGQFALKVTELVNDGWAWRVRPAETDSEIDQAKKYLGFSAGTVDYGGVRMYQVSLMIMPHAFVVFLTMILPGFWLVIWAVRRGRWWGRNRGGQTCLACGYDLRGNSKANNCPECGTAV
jgi:hypothetical protein